MLEIVFGKTAARSLQYAGVPAESILCFDQNLSMRDLTQKELPEFSKEVIQLPRRGSLRVWYSQNPDELCGFYWLAEQLERIEIPELHGIELPPYFALPDGTVVTWNSWNEMDPETWKTFLHQKNPIPRNYRRNCAMLWRELTIENAPLRAVVNGSLVSVPLDFYDFFIQKELDAADETFVEEHLVGCIIARYGLKISDALIAQRIETRCKTRELEIISPAEAEAAPPRRILKKTT